MSLKRLHICKHEYEEFRALQIKPRSDWLAVFSVNRKEEVWPFVCYGRTPEEERRYVPPDGHRLLYDIARVFVSNVNERGGRFFINAKGVFGTKDEIETSENLPEQFVEWRPDEELETAPGEPLTYEQLMAKVRGR